jgi:ubiquitin-activating enzyme E1
MASSDVLIVGLGGLGVEVAKNVVLAGVKSVTLLDPQPAEWADLSANFFLSESDVGQPRAAAVVDRLSELNRYVKVTVSPEPLESCGGPYLSAFQTVVMIGQPLALQLSADAYCHKEGICFVAGEARGVFGRIFCDFGPSYVVLDKDDQQASSCLVNSITCASPPLVTVMDDQRHGLSDGDTVSFAGVKGMPEVEGREWQVKVTDPFCFELCDCDATCFQPFVSGYVNQIKKAVTVAFKPLAEALNSPEPLMETDFAKIGRPALLHAAFAGLDAFQAEQGRLPSPADGEDADKVVAMAGSAAPDIVAEGEKVIRALSRTARGVVSPACAALGGIVGQEVLKACSGKFTPLGQWLYWDAEEALPDPPLGPAAVAPLGSRYDGQIMVFGREMQEKIAKQSLFLVGAGAIGCEMLKNWAMMGIACDPEGGGMIHVTDMDHIEKSNLSRQFLFRETDIQKPKSDTAAAAAKSMNPALCITSHEQKCAPSTEEYFGDEFYEKLDGVCTALDNVEARLYVDQVSELSFSLPTVPPPV